MELVMPSPAHHKRLPGMIIGVCNPMHSNIANPETDFNPTISPTSEDSSHDKNPGNDFPNQHRRCRELGVGSEGYVSAWLHKPSKTVVAVKVIRKEEATPREVEILKNLPPHESIVRMYGYYTDEPSPSTASIILEYCAAGDLFDLKKDMYEINKSIFSEGFLWSLLRQLASAIAFLHEGIGCSNPRDYDNWRPVVHRDIKIENILISTKGKKDDMSDIIIKLCDFGLADFYDPDNARMPGRWGTCILWPPEQTWNGCVATPAGDVWAVGCIIHELAHTFPPVLDPVLYREQVTQNIDVEEFERSLKGVDPKYYWEAEAPRCPLPINVDSERHQFDRRRFRPTPKYSDSLNECMLMSLRPNKLQRASAGELLEVVEEQEAAYYDEKLAQEALAWDEEHWSGEESEDEGVEDWAIV